MRFLITLQQRIPSEDDSFIIETPSFALKYFEDKFEVGLDTETEGFDPYSKKVLLCQIGDSHNQFAIDYTVPLEAFKDFFEDPKRLFILHNAKFDLRFFYHKRIVIRNVFDTYLAEKIKWLGYPSGIHGMGLKDCCKQYLNIDLDKSVRGSIHREGLSDRVIVYGCRDVEFLIPLMNAQKEALAKQDLLVSIDVENHFVPILAYIEYCGAKLDKKAWKDKMAKDQKNFDQAKKALDDWVVKYCLQNYNPSVGPTVHCATAIGSEEEIKRQEKEYLPENAKVISREIIAKGPESTVEIKYILNTPVTKWITVNTQGDLFSGFNTEPICNINWASSKQVIPVFEHLGFNLTVTDKKTKMTKKSVEAKVIAPQRGVSPIADLYITYKGYEKLITTYGQNFLDAINPVSGRIHTQFQQLMDTGRLSCGGGTDKDTGKPLVNLQNIPSDKETRACFIAEPGNVWISEDYKGQESVIIADTSEDPAMIRFFQEGRGDIHSLVAKMVFKDELKDCPIEDVKEKFHARRQEAKGYEFLINYGGDFNTMKSNYGLEKEEALTLYNNYMEGFPGIKRYQDFRRKDVMDKGYILLNPIVRNKAYIYDYKELMEIKSKMTKEFWDDYRADKQAGLTTERTEMVRKFFKRKADSEKQSINYPIQATGALTFKFASIKFFDWLVKNDLLFKVLYVVPVHDEINVEAPEELAEIVANALAKSMRDAGNIFCKPIPLDVSISMGNHWIH